MAEQLTIDNPNLSPDDVAILLRKLRNLPADIRAEIVATINQWTPASGPIDVDLPDPPQK